MTYESVAQCAGEISGQHIGGSWPKRFLKRHPDLRMKKTVGLEKARAKGLNQTVVHEFFNMLADVINEYSILPENLYNMDEKGIQLGIGARITAMIDRSQKMAYSIEDGNREPWELVTIIEAICADGSILYPSVIFRDCAGNPRVTRLGPHPHPHLPVPATRTGLPVKTSPKTAKTVEK